MSTQVELDTQATQPPEPGESTERRDAFADLRRRWKALPEETRRKAIIGSVIGAYVILLGLGGWWNLSLFNTQTDLSDQISRHEAEIARAPQVRLQLQEATLEQARLRAERDRLYSRVPDIAAVPVIVGRLEEVALAVGGEITDIYYQEPFWHDDTHGVVGIDIVFVGDFYAVENYFSSVLNSMPSLRWSHLDLEPTDKGGLVLQMRAHGTVDVMERPIDEVTSWADEQPILYSVATRLSPFEIAARVGAPMPDVVLTGVVQQNGRSLALLSIDGAGHVVAQGQRVGDLVVEQISSRSVTVRNGDRVVQVPLTD